ncbi:sulfite exporter TauE/SafE family protein [Candidatus Kaiserbacteria bacterium]|nr:sulfite exporter TauE/SafE family protein [Candidatus Kaiserbacteria bacterium]
MEATVLILPAFIAGILTFLAPCTLPMVPAYLGFISGASAQEALGDTSGRLRRRIFFNGLAFVLGFSAVFILFGVFAGYLGHLIPGYRLLLTQIGGVFVIAFGLFMLGVFNLPFLSGVHRMNVTLPFARGSYLNAFGLGAAFGTGWTPCIGPILGSILLLATTEGSVGSGALLLGVFSFGLAIPFLLVAAALGSAEKKIQALVPYLGIVAKVSGTLLVVIGALLLTDNMSYLAGYMYKIFWFINYDALLAYF